jgi:XTP/dITP diphosphohydrolase
MKVLIGTKNPYKAGVMEYILKDLPNIQIYFLKDTDIDVDVEEDGDTLIDNARKKAVEISKHTDMYVLTSDGGVDIPGLKDKWDILRNQRIVGHDNSDDVKVRKVLDLMTGLKGEARKAEYHLALSLAKNGEIIETFEDITDRGYIVENLPKGDIPYGMWMGHIWYYPKFNKTLTQLDNREVAKVNELLDGLKKEIKTVLKDLE